MSDEPRLTHVRADMRTTKVRSGKALCGVPQPSSSYGYAHARLILLGRFARSSGITLCPACVALLREKVHAREGTEPEEEEP